MREGLLGVAISGKGKRKGGPPLTTFLKKEKEILDWFQIRKKMFMYDSVFSYIIHYTKNRLGNAKNTVYFSESRSFDSER